MAEQVLLYDTTLRDGMQGEGMSLSAEEKVDVAHALDDLGVDMIEAGFPSSNRKEAELFELLARETFATACIAAFGMTRRRDCTAGDDPALRVLADCFAPICTLVGKTWSLHLDKVTGVDPSENLSMIEDSVAFLRAQGKRVVYDAEHFFDAWAVDSDYALRCLQVAVDAGAENVTLCDTNGATLPMNVAAATAAVFAALGDRVQVGIHTHDDAGCGVANSLVAVESGARMVQGTINGYGERCGNANLTTILPNLQLKQGYDCVTADQLEMLTQKAYLIDEICNVVPNKNQPYVGMNAFAHKGGMHTAGVMRDARTFEHIEPALVGADRRILVSELGGKSTVLARAEATGVELTDEQAVEVIENVKDLESRGYHLEPADGSFDLLIAEAAGTRPGLVDVHSWRVIVERSVDGEMRSEATLKLKNPDAGELKDSEGRGLKNSEAGELFTAEGNGPLNALDNALWKALKVTHGLEREIDLVNFKVRILDEGQGTGAITRVLLDATDRVDSWGTIGVSSNIIEASWEALIDAIEAGLLPHRAGGAKAKRLREARTP